MRLKKKATLYMSAAAIVMVVVLLFASIALFRHFAVISIQPGALSIAKMVRETLTMAMAQGTVHGMDKVLDKLKSQHGILDARIFRSQAVIKQHGPGRTPDYKMTEREYTVLKTRQPVYDVSGFGADSRFITTIPYIASSTEQPNCLSCHQVAEGTVMGAITLEIPLADQWRITLISGLVISGIMALIAIVVIVYIRRALAPFESTAQEINLVMNKANAGDFSGAISQSSDDEIGHIARLINQLLKLVDTEVKALSSKVADLLHYKAPLGNNLLLSMTELVEGLVEVSRFKQTIEEDETRTEVYARLCVVLAEHFHIKRSSLYEVDSDKHRMLPVRINGESSEECRWCNPEILIRDTACRARRTGQMVDSVDSPGICPAFEPQSGETGLAHICIPVNQSGSVGNVLQLVVESNQADLTQMFVPFIAQYLREAAPVIESKRLMDALRQSSLTDPMTGLHNRRFLEEFTQNLVAYTERNKSSFSILMADLDFFKQVNDTYGHEAGDTVLKELAKALRSGVRTSDMVIRYGGEEFLIILRDTEGENADMVAEKLRAKVEAMKVELTGAQLQKTISIGVATFPADSDSFWQVVKYADVALYQAKETGRNRVLHFRPEMWTDEAVY